MKDVFSPSMDKIGQIARNDKGQLKGKLCTFVIKLAAAKDAGHINFDNAEDEAAFHGLLADCLIQMVERQ